MKVKNIKGMCIVMMSLALACKIEAKQFEIGYKDVPTTHWAYESVELLSKRGLLKDLFTGEVLQLEKPITRAEYLGLIVNGAELESHYVKLPFKDIDEVPKTLQNKIIAAYSSGLVKGIEKEGNIQLNPNAPITREEASTILGRMLQVETSSQNPFKDDEKISNWAKKYVVNLAATQVIKGYEDETFRPQKTITRAEAIAIIKRVMESDRLANWENNQLITLGQEVLQMPTGIAKGAGDELYVIEEKGHKISKINKKTGIKENYLTNETAQYTGLVQVKDVLYVVDKSEQSLSQVKDGKTVKVLDEKAQLSEPRGLAYDEGILYIADTGNNRIVMFKDNELTVLKSDQLKKPYDIAVTDDVCYIADTGNGQIGKLVDGKYSVIASGFDMPTGIEVVNGYVYVVDQGTNRVYSIDPQNNVKSILGNGYATGLNAPTDLVYDKGKLYVSDSLNSRLIVYTLNMKE